MEETLPYFEEQIPLMNWILVLVGAFLITIPAVFAAWIGLRQWVPRWAAWMTVVFLCFLLFVMLSTRLWVRVDERGVSYQYMPFHWSPRLLRWTEIKRAYCRVHYAEIEYGNWGIAGNEHDRAYTMPGVYGIQIVLVNRDRVLISVSSPEEVTDVLRYYLLKKKQYEAT